eukprot:3417499-Pyramimonas_sp.AAC.1
MWCLHLHPHPLPVRTRLIGCRAGRLAGIRRVGQKRPAGGDTSPGPAGEVAPNACPGEQRHHARAKQEPGGARRLLQRLQIQSGAVQSKEGH